jgi:hypothetical protein
MGDLIGWGVKHERHRVPENGPTTIDPGFWTRADFYPQLMLKSPTIRSAGNGEQGLIYSEIIFDRNAVDTVWPLCQDAERSAFHEIYEVWNAQWEEEHKEPPNV